MSNEEERRKAREKFIKDIMDSGFNREEAQLALDISIHAAQEAQEAQRVLMASCETIEDIEVRKVAVSLAMMGTEAAMQAGIQQVREMVAAEESGQCQCVVCQIKRQLVPETVN